VADLDRRLSHAPHQLAVHLRDGGSPVKRPDIVMKLQVQATEQCTCTGCVKFDAAAATRMLEEAAAAG